jgi:hypothetical protein
MEILFSNMYIQDYDNKMEVHLNVSHDNSSIYTMDTGQ